VRIVYNAFDGRYADNPQAIYAGLMARESADEHVWLAAPHHLDGFPPEVPTVPIGTPAAFEALEAADLVVANCHTLGDTWNIRPDTFYLQTWHGTPLKRIHRNAVNTVPGALMDEIDVDIARWDALITPSQAGTRLLRSAFHYTGPLWETGYPRNDVLNGPDREATRERIRRQLGIAESSTVILYAPTYRDDDLAEQGVALGFDPNALVDDLDDHHVLLVRRHYYLTRHTRIDNSDRIRDVTGHPDISELYLAADVLITDYSSALFDFAVTG
jgi:CDP-glycerol glycerophosphotransferase